MPCYYWKGIDGNGSIHRGVQFYRSQNHLEQDLLSKNIGLIDCRVRNDNYRQRVSVQWKDFFIEHLYTLLKSQIRLHQAIELSSNSIAHPYFKQIIADMSSIVLEGQPLYKALGLYPKIFDSLTVNIICAGEESSNLNNALQLLVNHAYQVREFKAKIKSALFMPALTLSFFSLVMMSFFIFIVPRFETFFQSFKAPLPQITQIVLSFSLFIRSNSLYYLSTIMLIFCVLFKIFQLPVFANVRDRISFLIPGIKNISIMMSRLKFLQILSLSLSSGMHLLGCLKLTYTIMNGKYLKQEIRQLIEKVENGVNISFAINESIFDDLETVSFIKLGESSGNLDSMTLKALHLYQKKFYSKVDYISSLVHPIVLLILGTLIALSIFAVYIPIFTLTSFIN